MSENLREASERYIAMAVLAGVRLKPYPSTYHAGELVWSVWLPETPEGNKSDSSGWWTRTRAAVWACTALGLISSDEKLLRLLDKDKANGRYLPKDLHV